MSDDLPAVSKQPDVHSGQAGDTTATLVVDISTTMQPSGDVRVMTGTFTVGNRHGDCTIQLDDEYVSNRHAAFYKDGGGWFAEDIGSTNGIYLVPEYRRRYEPLPLSRGTKVRIGHTILTVVPLTGHDVPGRGEWLRPPRCPGDHPQADQHRAGDARER